MLSPLPSPLSPLLLGLLLAHPLLAETRPKALQANGYLTAHLGKWHLGDWKLQHYFEDDAIELYNLREDLSETTNLAEENPQKAKEPIDSSRISAPTPTPLSPANSIPTETPSSNRKL